MFFFFVVAGSTAICSAAASCGVRNIVHREIPSGVRVLGGITCAFFLDYKIAYIYIRGN